MSFIVHSSKSFDATKQAALISAVIQDCEETLATTPAFHSADYADTCHCKANLEHVISYINDAPDAKTKFERAVDYAEIICRNNSPPAPWRLSEEALVSRHMHNWVTTRIDPFVTKVPRPVSKKISKKVDADLINAVIQDCEESMTRYTDEFTLMSLRYTIRNIRSKENVDLQYAEARRWAEAFLAEECGGRYVTTRVEKFVTA